MNLPTCLDAERWVLGACLRYPRHLDIARPVIQSTDFSLDDHQRIWRRVCELFDSGTPVDYGSVAMALDAQKELEILGGLTRLIELSEGIPNVQTIEHYIEAVRETGLRRRMIYTAQKLATRASDTTDPIDTVANAWADAVADFSTGAAGMNGMPISSPDAISEIGIEKLLGPQHHRGLHLPWKKLDRDLSGLGPGQMIVLLAETSRGKTSMALQVATCAAQQGYTPLIWTMEMSIYSLMRRMVNQLSGVYPGKRILSREERDAQGLSVATLNDNPIYFDRTSRSVSSFMASLRYVRSKCKLGIGIVDYLQQIRDGSQRGNRAGQVSENSRNLKLAAMDFEIPLWVLSQVDRSSVKGEGEIGLHSGKESGDIENDADVQLAIQAPELAWDQPTTVGLKVLKQREGAAGFNIPMVFRPQSQTFEEIRSEDYS